MELRNQKKKKFIAWYYKLITFGFAQLKKNTIANNREIYLKKKKEESLAQAKSVHEEI
jgi:hypothetical protein